MHRKFITLIIVAAIAVTGFSAPARAGNKDFAKALAGLAALAIIGAAIHDNRNHRPAVSRRETVPVYRAPKHRRHWYVTPRPMPQHVARTILPQSCIRNVDLGHGKRTQVLGRDCMYNNYRFTRTLPSACVQRNWGHRGARRGFNVHCLKQNGYRISRR